MFDGNVVSGTELLTMVYKNIFLACVYTTTSFLYYHILPFKRFIEGMLHKHEDNTRKEKEYLPLEKLINMSLDIARGMEYILSQGLVNHDTDIQCVVSGKKLSLKVSYILLNPLL